jgi:hypothetical protein
MALRRFREALNRLDADHGRYRRDFETAPGLAEVLFHGVHIEPPGDLLGGGDREVVASDLSEAAAFELVFERFAFRFGTLERGIGIAEHIGKCLVRDIVKARYGGRNRDSLGHKVRPLAWVSAERALQAPVQPASKVITLIQKVNN